MRRTAVHLPVAAVVLSTVGAVALAGDLGATLTSVAGLGGGPSWNGAARSKAAPGTEDAAARFVVEGIYDAGFANLKTMAAAQ